MSDFKMKTKKLCIVLIVLCMSLIPVSVFAGWDYDWNCGECFSDLSMATNTVMLIGSPNQASGRSHAYVYTHHIEFNTEKWIIGFRADAFPDGMVPYVSFFAECANPWPAGPPVGSSVSADSVVDTVTTHPSAPVSFCHCDEHDLMFYEYQFSTNGCGYDPAQDRHYMIISVLPDIAGILGEPQSVASNNNAEGDLSILPYFLSMQTPVGNLPYYNGIQMQTMQLPGETDANDKLYVRLSSLSAISSEKGTLLAWVTECEIDNAGFNVYRSFADKADYAQINKQLIPSASADGRGSRYSFTDSSVKPGKKYSYKLEDVDYSGKSTFHGPVEPVSLKGDMNGDGKLGKDDVELLRQAVRKAEK